MKTKPECLDCFIRQMERVADRFSAKEEVKKQTARNIREFLANSTFDLAPPYLSEKIYQMIKDSVGKVDPYQSVKKSQNDMALMLEERIENLIRGSDNPVLTAIKCSIAGNTIDFGAQKIDTDVEKAIDKIIKSRFSESVTRQFFVDLNRSRKAVIVLDNCGEVVFDKLLIKTIKERFDIEFTAVVRGGPIINDVTAEDARYVGIDRYAEIVESSFAAPGALAKRDEKLKKLFDNSDMIISKGQGNFESLSETGWTVYFLFLSKCDVVSRITGSSLFSPLFFKQTG